VLVYLSGYEMSPVLSTSFGVVRLRSGSVAELDVERAHRLSVYTLCLTVKMPVTEIGISPPNSVLSHFTRSPSDPVKFILMSFSQKIVQYI
jgi:hypothetical protein